MSNADYVMKVKSGCQPQVNTGAPWLHKKPTQVRSIMVRVHTHTTINSYSLSHTHKHRSLYSLWGTDGIDIASHKKQF